MPAAVAKSCLCRDPPGMNADRRSSAACGHRTAASPLPAGAVTRSIDFIRLRFHGGGRTASNGREGGPPSESETDEIYSGGARRVRTTDGQEPPVAREGVVRGDGRPTDDMRRPPRPIGLTRIETRIGGRRLPRGGPPRDRVGRAHPRWGSLAVSRCLSVLLIRCTCVLMCLINVRTRYVLRAYAREQRRRGTSYRSPPSSAYASECVSEQGGGGRARSGANGREWAVLRGEAGPRSGRCRGRSRNWAPPPSTVGGDNRSHPYRIPGGVSYRKQWEGRGGSPSESETDEIYSGGARGVRTAHGQEPPGAREGRTL